VAANPRIDDLRKRLEREPGSRLFAQLAEELRKEGEFEEAIRVSREGLQKHPAYPSARMTLGRALLDSGDLTGARGEFETVLKSAPDNILAGRFLGECLEALGDHLGALARYKTTLTLAPDDRQLQTRAEALQTRLAAPSPAQNQPDPLAATIVEPRPLAVHQSFEPIPAEEPRVQTGQPPPAQVSPEAPPLPEPPPIPLVAADESFEIERPYEFPTRTAASTERTVEETPASSARDEAETPPEGVEDAPLAKKEDSVDLSSATLAELYFSQGLAEKAIQVYRQLLQREPGNERARTRLAEIEALDRQLTVEAGTLESGDPKAARRLAIERTIARLERLLLAIKKE